VRLYLLVFFDVFLEQGVNSNDSLDHREVVAHDVMADNDPRVAGEHVEFVERAAWIVERIAAELRASKQSADGEDLAGRRRLQIDEQRVGEKLVERHVRLGGSPGARSIPILLP
jgi:hypothetical protein